MDGRRDWRGGSAPNQALVMKAEVDRPEALTRRSNSARNSFGGRYETGASRLLLCSAGMVLLAGCCPSALASTLPRRLPAAARGSRGAKKPAPVDGCPEGEPKFPFRSKPVPKHRSWSRARKPGRGLQGGATIPLLDGSRESRSLPGRDA